MIDSIPTLNEKINRAISYLTSASEQLCTKLVVAGFDGFVDTVSRPVKRYESQGNVIYFDTIAEFGTHVVEKQNKSCAIELRSERIKYGGNMPNFAYTLSGFGIPTKCIGAFGQLAFDSVFNEMSQRCELYSVAEPGKCTALEFNDGKVMLYDNSGLNDMDWNKIVDKIGLEPLSDMVDSCDILGLFNFGEVPHMENIVEKMVRTVFPRCKSSCKKIILIDFSDFSNRSKDSIKNMMKLIRQIQQKFCVILSLNTNEYEMLCAVCDIKLHDKKTDEQCSRRLLDVLGVDMLIQHSHDCARAWNRNGMYCADNCYVSNPFMSTGGGDNFNAGICLALMLGADPASALVLANAAAGFYVKNGYSASLEQLYTYLVNWREGV